MQCNAIQSNAELLHPTVTCHKKKLSKFVLRRVLSFPRPVVSCPVVSYRVVLW